MISYSGYLSDDKVLQTALNATGLSLDEIELLVGRFARHGRRAGQLRGEFVSFVDGTLLIRKSFGKKELWRLETYGG